MNDIFGYYVLTTSLISFFALWYWFSRLTNPLKCACGYETIFIRRFKRHLLMGHKWQSH